MSERPIQKGDLVVVVRGCGCWLGSVFTVDTVIHHEGLVECNCHFSKTGMGPIAINSDPGNGTPWCHPVSWLLKIDPPAIGDTHPTRADAGIKERV